MARRRFLIVAVLIVSSLAVSCGIPQEEYDTAVVAKDSIQLELDSVQSQLKSIQSELESTQSEAESAQNELESIQSELESTQSDLEEINAELQSVKSQLSSSQSTVRNQKSNMDKASNYVAALNVFLYPVRKEAGMEQLIDFEDEVEWLKTLDKIVFNTEDDAFQIIYTEWKLGQVEAGEGFARFLSHIAIKTLRTLD
ncbi:hypothetical protein ACFLU1_01555 [Chloroflexota bacterium]